MAVSLEQFAKHLEDSGILAGDTIRNLIHPKGSAKDAEDLAKELVRQKKLTRFQAEEAYRGKGKSLVLGNYVLMEKIGAGGMGQVFKARHRRMDRIVAVKLLPAELTRDPSAIARFEREVKAAAKLRHPNIVAADDADEANGVHFLVMEYIDGSDLSALVKKNGPFPVNQALDYILQAARGLKAAHAEGIVHRDIKPANLLLDKNGTVKILDMGLARIQGDTGAQAELTGTGTVMGTVDYMAPEQALNTKAADARADIYSLGCALYYLLTGKATYEGDSLMAKLLAHREQPIPELNLKGVEISQPLDGIFKKMVAKKVDDRYQTIAAVITDLEKIGSSKTVAIKPAPKKAELEFDFSDAGPTITVSDDPLPSRSYGRKKKSSKRAAGNRNNLLIGGGVAGFLILLAVLVISLRTKNGTIIVEINEPGAEVQVFNEQGKVEITRKGEKSPLKISLAPGKHRLEVEKDGFSIYTREFSLATRGTESISAKLVPLEDKEVAPIQSVTSAVAANSPSPPDTASNNDGWVSLFNGRDLTGWKQFPGDNGIWEVKDGILSCGGNFGSSYLYSQRDDYKDFHFRVEARVLGGTNGGQYFRARYDPSFPKGYEAQINSTGPDPIKTGSLYKLVNINEVLVPSDEWFTQEVIANGDRIAILVNGKQVVDYRDKSPASTSGHLALQFNGGGPGVQFRKVEIKELTGSDSAPIDGDWVGTPGLWTVGPQDIVGSGNMKINTFLCTKKLWRDFELTCQVRLIKGNSGIQIRSQYIDKSTFRLRGPQVDFGEGYWGSLYGEQTTGMMRQASADVVKRVVKPNEFNDVYIRCAGKRVTIKLNNEVTVDEDFPAMADEGTIGLQMHSPTTEVTFRNLQIKDLSSSTTSAQVMQDMQGVWRCVAAEETGKAQDEATIQSEQRTFTFKGDTMEMSRFQQGQTGVYRGKFTIDPANSHFDFNGMYPNGGAIAFIGIYELNGDTLKFSYRYQRNGQAVRATEFKTDADQTNVGCYYTLKRVAK